MDRPSGSSSENFDFNKLCFLCAKKLDKLHKKVSKIANDSSKERFLQLCDLNFDENSVLVRERLNSVSSLVDVKASYHKLCYDRFVQVLYPGKTKKHDRDYEAALQNVYNFIENSSKNQFTLFDFQNIMKEQYRSNEILYTALRKKFGDEISIITGKGKEPKIVYKKADISKICTDWHYDKDNVSDGAKKTILRVAAEILKGEIKACNFDRSTYPPSSTFLDNVSSEVPALLSYFMDNLLFVDNEHQSNKTFVRRDSIAHSILCTVRSKQYLSTLQLAVGVYLLRKTGSKLIIELLSKLGVCATYNSILLYETSTVMDPAEFVAEDTFLQFVFDNTDHNVSTLDGRETFHCLGGIGVYTPGANVVYQGNTKRLKKMPSASILAKQKQIRTIPFRSQNKISLNKIKYIATSSLDLPELPLLQHHCTAYLWSKYLQLPDVPSWKGYMQIISSATDYMISHVTCLPFINEPPSNLTTINTSLHYALQETVNKNQQTCFVTYDQPLYLKARSIVSELDDTSFNQIVVRLGGFHLLMSYLGAIGHIMEGSGLEDLWSIIYAPQSIKKMMLGNAFSRSVRAHILTFTAMGIVICENINAEKELNKNKSKKLSNNFKEYEESKNNIKTIFAHWSTEPPLSQDINQDPSIQRLTAEMTNYIEKIGENGRTAELWAQYFKAVSVALQFIEAERLGDWKLHLQSVRSMLPLFHASGHFAYAKSAQIYLQDMAQLEIKMDPVEFDKYTKDGYFTIRRSDQAWSGIWSDMTIEQTLNRFFGTDLKHGRGVTPSVVARYLLGMPAAFNIMENLENFLLMKSYGSEQHIDSSESRRNRDNSDIASLLTWLNEHKPFEKRQCLLSLSTGIIGGEEINCHNAYQVGKKSMETMIGNSGETSVKRIYKVKTLLQAKFIHVDDKCSPIDPLMLFQRISMIIQGDEKKMREAFQYELSPFPLTLFDEDGFMRKTSKAQLYNVFKPFIEDETFAAHSTIVIDGGWLLHSVVWPHSRTFGEIFELYRHYILIHYGDNVTVVFDGYCNNTIGVKSYERYRRKEKSMAADVCIAEDNVINMTQNKFLSNIGNKAQFVEMLSLYLQKSFIKTQIAAEDADVLIVNTALEQLAASPMPVIVIGNDVDLLILLVALTPPDNCCYFLKKATGKAKNTLFSTRDQKHIKEFILFAHAFAGCDSTSAFFGKGKKTIINILINDKQLQNEIGIFYRPHNLINNLYDVAEKIVFKLYCKNKIKTSAMTDLRYKCFKMYVASAKKEISIASLPPTKEVLLQHTKRVYYQIQQWLGNTLNPDDWGWKRTQQILIPVLNTKEAAPKDLLNIVHCSCTKDCSSLKCSCKKSGLRCTALCRHCNGESCLNLRIPSDPEDEDSNDDEDNSENEEEGGGTEEVEERDGVEEELDEEMEDEEEYEEIGEDSEEDNDSIELMEIEESDTE